MFLAPLCVGRVRTLVESRVCVAENESDRGVWVLFPYQQVFCTVIDREPAFALDVEMSVWCVNPEIRCVLGLPFWDRVSDLVGLVIYVETRITNLFRQFVL